MKAFDVIGAVHEESDQSEDRVHNNECYPIEQVQELKISIEQKVEMDSITHDMRKPKFHLIRTKEPPIHVINSKKKGVLGVDTGTEQWTTGFQQPVGQAGFFDMFRNFNAGTIQMHKNQLQNQTSWRNPLNGLKEQFNNRNPGHSSHPPANPMQAGVGKNQSQLLGPANNIPMGMQNAPLKMSLSSNIIQSQVKVVELKDLPHSLDDSEEAGLGKKITNFFFSLKEKLTSNSTEDHKVEKQGGKQGSRLHKDQNIFESQVRSYNPERPLRETMRRQVVIEQSMVIEESKVIENH